MALAAQIDGRSPDDAGSFGQSITLHVTLLYSHPRNPTSYILGGVLTVKTIPKVGKSFPGEILSAISFTIVRRAQYCLGKNSKRCPNAVPMLRCKEPVSGAADASATFNALQRLTNQGTTSKVRPCMHGLSPFVLRWRH